MTTTNRQPPIDNAHVEPGCELFSAETIASALAHEWETSPAGDPREAEIRGECARALRDRFGISGERP
jgi:hypothetical protein